MNGAICLPVLDGTRAATNARLEAWLRLGEYDAVEDAIYGVRCHIEEAVTSAQALASPAEECDNEGCVKAGDVEFLLDELGKAVECLTETEGAAIGLAEAS